MVEQKEYSLFFSTNSNSLICRNNPTAIVTFEHQHFYSFAKDYFVLMGVYSIKKIYQELVQIQYIFLYFELVVNCNLSYVKIF